jgi:hypothetical protein
MTIGLQGGKVQYCAHTLYAGAHLPMVQTFTAAMICQP